jgi:hypothetical protein
MYGLIVPTRTTSVLSVRHAAAVMSNTNTPVLVGLEEGRILLFGHGPEAISKRCFAEWKARGYFPYVKIGKRVFINVDEVRMALHRRFKIQAREI